MLRVIFLLVVAGVLGAACGGSSSGSNETCRQTTCPIGSGTFKACTSASGASCRFVTSDGTAFDCPSCSDCTSAASQASRWCSGADAGGLEGGTGSGCATQTVCANSGKDCAAGQRCNTALSPPVCAALYCGSGGSVCAGDSANDLCASRQCIQGACADVPDGSAGSSCCAPGRQGNELGVGKYCATSSDCAGSQATACMGKMSGGTNGFCSTLCKATTSDCGSNAMCRIQSGGVGFCVPTNCDPQPCGLK